MPLAFLHPWHRASNLIAAGFLITGIPFAWVVIDAANQRPVISFDARAAVVAISSAAQPTAGEDGWPHLIAAADAWQGASDDAVAWAHERASRLELFPGQAADDPIRIDGIDLDVLDTLAPVQPIPPMPARPGPDAPAEAHAAFHDAVDARRAVYELSIKRTIAERAYTLAIERGLNTHTARLAACPRIIRPLAGEGSLHEAELPELGRSRLAAKVQSARVRRALAAGDTAEALAGIEAGLALARALAVQHFLVDALVAEAITALMDVRIDEFTAAHAEDPAALRGLLAVLERQARPAVNSAWIACERIGSADVIQRLFTDDGDGDGIMLPIEAHGLMQYDGADGPPPPSRWLNAGGYFLTSRRETQRVFDEMYASLAELTATPPALRADRSIDLGDIEARATTSGAYLARVLLPSLGRAIGTFDESGSERAIQRITIALEVHRAEHGAYPQSLDGLVPTILAEQVIDPWTGEPFVYAPAPATITSAAPGATPPPAADGRPYYLCHASDVTKDPPIAVLMRAALNAPPPTAPPSSHAPQRGAAPGP